MSSETLASQTDPTPDWVAPIEKRRERADYYFLNILENQHAWYNHKSGAQKRLHLGFGIWVTVLGALISCLQVVKTDWVPILTAVMGACVSIVRAIDTDLLRPGQTWQLYRKASEKMRREYRLYINNVDVYNEATDEDSAYRLLVTRVETIITEEQQLFGQIDDKTQQAKTELNN